ncbi:DUF2946 domain-containing protein [Variovorax dokdonensis]|uniref:DUF2946 domain-containing protein n=1 Tax=Variovorax dokdonensis TaxID=344883 RepID=A0ABT7N4P2_9BURK|nr:DUF2946 domain-containing protein [Variovorax dokdonensis]MDM0042906.1 DUF2946 domain-containing protein [Variovorax dokdonensis]
MSKLRSFQLMARLVLAWFFLTLGVAVASPLIHPQKLQWVCAGAKVVLMGEDGQEKTSPFHTALDCPACLAAIGPAPSPEPFSLPQAQPLGYALHPIESARLASLVGAPLPARGPPVSI